MLYGASIPSKNPIRLPANTKLLCLKAALHISVCRFDKPDEGRRIDVAIGPELYVAHVLAITFQQAHWIFEFGATEKSDIDMGCERVDIGEGGISDTRGRMTVMQQLSHISTLADDVEPLS